MRFSAMLREFLADCRAFVTDPEARVVHTPGAGRGGFGLSIREARSQGLLPPRTSELERIWDGAMALEIRIIERCQGEWHGSVLARPREGKSWISHRRNYRSRSALVEWLNLDLMAHGLEYRIQ